MSIGIIRSQGPTSNPLDQIFTWETKTVPGDTITSYNVYRPFISAPNTKSGIVRDSADPAFDQSNWLACLSSPSAVPAEKCLFTLFRDSYSGFVQNTVVYKTTASTAWGDIGATYTTTVDATLYNVAHADYFPIGMIRLKSGALVAVFNSTTPDGAQGQTYIFRYRNPSGTWDNPATAFSCTLPRYASSLTQQRCVMIQHSNGSIWFFRHLMGDTAIGMIKLIESNGALSLNVSYSNFLSPGNTYAPMNTDITLSISADPVQGGFVLAYPTTYQPNTFPNSVVGYKVALFHVTGTEGSSFNEMVGKYIPDTGGFIVACGESPNTPSFFAGQCFDTNGVLGNVQVGVLGGTTWTFTDFGNTNPIYPIRDDFNNSSYGTGLISGFASDASGTISFRSFSSFQVGNTPGTLEWELPFHAVLVSTVEGSVLGTALDLDSSGNSYVGLHFEETIQIGATTYHGSDHPFNAMALAKVSPAGSVSWSRLIQATKVTSPYEITTAFLTVYGIACDSSGNFYFAGQFYSRLDFGGTSTPIVSADNGVTPSLFIAKFDNATGTCRWTVSYPLGVFAAIKCDSNDNLIFTQNGHLVKLDKNNGSELMNVNFLVSGFALVYSMSIDSSGDIILCGSCSAGTNLGAGPMTPMGGGGNADIVLFRLNSLGACLWSRAFGGSGNDYGYAVKVDNSTGLIYMGGVIWTGLDFGSGPIGANGGAFITCFSANGNTCHWSISTGDYSSHVDCVDVNSGKLGIAGKSRSAINWGTWPTNPWMYTNAANYFLATFSLNGTAPPTYNWTNFPPPNSTPQNDGTSTPYGLKLTPDNSIILDGIFNANINFGNNVIDSGGNSGKSNFLVKYAF